MIPVTIVLILTVIALCAIYDEICRTRNYINNNDPSFDGYLEQKRRDDQIEKSLATSFWKVDTKHGWSAQNPGNRKVH